MKDIFVTVFVFAIIILAVFGWCFNIYKLFELDTLNGEALVRAIGIVVAPLGAILGFV